MKKSFPILLSLTLLLSGASCKRVTTPKPAEEREQFLLSLNDSITSYKAEIDSASAELTRLQASVGERLGNFVHVSNPREVEGYYILSGWKARYPLTSTGIIARINESEGFEIIAALAKGAFDQIAVSAGNATVASAVVPHDQALNYRTATLNTVCFYGAAADSVGEFIADNAGSDIMLSFIGKGTVAKIKMAADSRQMIADTWRLYADQRQSHLLEKKIPLLSRRIDVCRRMMESADSVSH